MNLFSKNPFIPLPLQVLPRVMPGLCQGYGFPTPYPYPPNPWAKNHSVTSTPGTHYSSADTLIMAATCFLASSIDFLISFRVAEISAIVLASSASSEIADQLSTSLGGIRHSTGFSKPTVFQVWAGRVWVQFPLLATAIRLQPSTVGFSQFF